MAFENKLKKNTKYAKKVPVIMQMEDLECGAACLAMVMAYYGKWIPLEQVRLDCGVSRDGSNARNMLKAARNYGLNASGYRVEPEEFKGNDVTYPCIIHWNFNHFVVLNGFKGDHAYINDPAKGFVRIPMKEFDEAFTGICLMLEPSENFEMSGARKSTLKFALKRLNGAGAAVAFVVLTYMITAIFGMIDPAFLRFFMDRLLTGENRELLLPFIALFSFVCILQIIVSALNAIYSLKINGKMAVIGSSTFMWKLLQLPMEFFSQRELGDLLLRQNTNATIANTVVQTLTPIAINAFMLVFYLVVMFRFSPILTLFGIIVLVLNLFIGRRISEKRVNISRIRLRDSGKLAAATISGIQMIETIKASGAERGYFKKWSGYQASVNTQNQAFVKISSTLGVLPELITELSGYGIMVIGVFLTMRGQFTIGMTMTFQALLSAFMQPASVLIDSGHAIQEMRTDMERVEDVMNYPDDDMHPEDTHDPDANYSKLLGNIEIKDISFGYSRLGKPLIENLSVDIKQGQWVALVGPSGSGKSTISKLVSGLYKPFSGEILFDGKRISEIDKSVFTGSVAVVDQDITLFEDTIENNIKMWDNSIENFEMILAARDAQIHEDIMKRPGGYKSRLKEGGKNLSGGQRQRLEIARVLAQDPSIIIMDEATSALDAKTEYDLVRAVRNRGITCIVIAHRLSTIRDCDEILVLDHGIVAERGTHEELYAKGGIYTELISNE